VNSSGSSPGTTPQSQTAYAVGTNRRSTASASAGVLGPVSADSDQNAQSTCAATWTATWVGNTATDTPGLYVLDEIKSKSAAVSIAGNGGSSLVTTGSTTLLASQDPTTVTPLAGTPVVTTTIDTSDAGHYVFSYERTTDTRTVTTTPTAGMAESVNDTTHIVHVYLASYFTAHCTDPTRATLTFTVPSADITATAHLLSGSVTGASATASGSISDAFNNYAVWGAN